MESGSIYDYRAFGVANIWVLDPVSGGRAYIYTLGDFREPENGTLVVAGSAIRICLRDLFAEME